MPAAQNLKTSDIEATDMLQWVVGDNEKPSCVEAATFKSVWYSEPVVLLVVACHVCSYGMGSK